MAAPDASRRWEPPHPTNAVSTLRTLWRGPRDRAMRFGTTPQEGVWRATRTPDGPCTQHISNQDGELVFNAWGPGSVWAAERAHILLGALDEDGTFNIDSAQHPLLHRAWRLNRATRVPCTLAVWEILQRVVIEQKVTGLEAIRSYGALLRRLGEPAPSSPGPALTLPPAPDLVAGTPHHVFMAAGVERKRADTIRRAAQYAHRLDEAAAISTAEAYRRLRAIPGIGEWTINEVGAIALGDSDAVSVGDYHLKNFVGWALAGEARATDERMVELLEPYRPHRARMIRVIGASGLKPPKYGPRLTIQKRW